ncbi:MAG: Coenzyme synthesis protein [Verrucomicrobiales bacterium]|nr:Coenzyme synthesis protein [Verrucomicrobiales bacterium]
MKVRVLGSAAGGGFPQWNCGCRNCDGVRQGTLNAKPRTQESLAISPDGKHWYLINASPDIHRQIQEFPSLWPKETRGSPIEGIILTNGDMDHCLGLLSLRESHPLVIYATAAVMRGFTAGNPMYRTLERFPGQVTWKLLSIGIEQSLTLSRNRESGLSIVAFPAPGKRPIHLAGSEPVGPEDNIGLYVREAGATPALAYFPSVAGHSGPLAEALQGATAILFDGTFWSEGEMQEAGVGNAQARDMAHWPTGGIQGSLAFMAGLAPRRRILTHINNTNPILREDAPERAEAKSAGLEVAWDGMEFSL